MRTFDALDQQAANEGRAMSRAFKRQRTTKQKARNRGKILCRDIRKTDFDLCLPQSVIIRRELITKIAA